MPSTMDSFDSEKRELLRKFRAGHDQSPKGTIDQPVLNLVNFINEQLADYVTTSSCSGRIAVFQEKQGNNKGICWLVVRHGLIRFDEVLLAVQELKSLGLVHLKCEGLILHIKCRDVESATYLHQLALSCGYREGGITVGAKNVMLAVRSVAFGLDAPISDGSSFLVSHATLELILKLANERLEQNFARITKFMQALKDSFSFPSVISHVDSGDQKSMKYSSKFDLFHAVAVPVPISCGVVLLSGGRISTQKPQLCLRLIRNSIQDIECSEEGEIPAPRWGHTLTLLSFDENSCRFCLVGGRNMHRVFADALILVLTVSSTANSEVWSAVWEKLALSPCQGVAALSREGTLDRATENGIGACRFFHAAAPLSNDMDSSAPLLLLHGGLSSLHTFSPSKLGHKEPLVVLNTRSGHWCRVRSEATALCFAHCLFDVGYGSFIVSCGPNAAAENLSVAWEPSEGTFVAQSSNLVFPNFQKCASCSCHALVKSLPHNPCVIFLTGGGCQTPGFAPHFCLDTCFSVTAGRGTTSLSRCIPPPTCTRREDEAGFLVTTRSKTKTVKTLLERLNWYDRSRRIMPVDSTTLLSVCRIPLKGNPIHDARKDSMETESDYNALPVSPKLWALLWPECHLLETSHAAELVATSGKKDTQQLLILCPGPKKPAAAMMSSKSSLQQRRHAEAAKLLRETIQLDNEVPLKFETVGDVLMLPDVCLRRQESNVFTKEALSGLWRDLLSFFPHCLRVAVKMPVDPGPMRESQVKLLYPPSPNPSTIFLNGYRPEDTGPGSPGWVTVLENGIEFSFDLTRVMFCSGNVTERMRAGRMVTRVQGRIVVDLYAGVGYYTLPYLCRAHAAHVHACEWNPNSIIALNHNKVANRVSPSRCTVYAADNKTTVESGVLDGIAQVVSLGLLPSSKQGWPLAARVLSLKGDSSVVFIHENVHEDDVASFRHHAESFFTNALTDRLTANEVCSCKVVHVEVVKSYAPRVLHIVLDLEVRVLKK